MESLGGSTRRRGSFNASGSQRLGSARPSEGSVGGGSNRDMNGSQRGRNSRPASAAGFVGNRSTPVSGGELMGSKRGVMSITKANAEMAKQRVADSHYAKEKQLWGSPIEEQGRVNRVRPVKPDLPAFWSVEEYGQPWSNEKLAQGAEAHWQILPDRVGGHHEPGPMVEARKSLRKSLESGQMQVDLKTLEPLDAGQARPLQQDEREYLIARLKPHERLFALRANRDRDWHDDDFQPWTRNIDKDYDREPWYRNMDNTIRMALTKLEWIMRQHLQYLSDKDYETFRAPTMPPKHILQRAFKKVDPQGTGYVSIEQFAQLWQNVLNLMDHEEVTKKINGKTRKALKPIGRRFVDRNTVAAIFCKYGFNKAGLMPYEVFVQSIISKNARLLGQELILDTKAVGRNGLDNTQEIGLAMSGAKIMYTLCRKGVYAPPDFEEDTAFRSNKPPRATMWLEHVYGYAGLKNIANNLFYTHRGEIAYYVGMIGIVWNKDLHDAGKPSQRFFFGHNNDITCMAIHPSRRFAATGQQTHDDGTPYLCIWDVDTMCQVQRLVHPDDMRSVVAVAFSSWGSSSGRKGGELVATVTSDDRHTVRIWRWMTKAEGSRVVDVTDPSEQVARAVYIPGWSYGPAKKIKDMEEADEDGQLFFQSHEATPDNIGKGAMRPSPTPPFDPENPTDKKSYLDELYCGKMVGSLRKANKSLSKRAPQADGDLRVKEFANWALNHNWPKNDHQDEFPGPWPEGWGSQAGLPGDPLKHPLVRDLFERPGWNLHTAKGFDYIDPPETKESDKPKDEAFVPGYCDKDRTWELVANFPGYQGTPPQIYGLQFNPFRNSTGRAGCEFLQYGVKHLKVWMRDEDQEDGKPGQWIGTAASFGSDKVSDVFSACFVPALHAGKSKTDACIIAGFPSGEIGLFIPSYPTRPGTVYALQQVFAAHHMGRVMTYPADARALPGSKSYSGVRVLRLRKRSSEGSSKDYEILSGGADGRIMVWRLSSPGGNKRGVAIGEPTVLQLDEANTDPTKADRIVGMDAYPMPDPERFPELKESKDEFVAGTDGCDIWEVDDSPRLLIEGAVGDVYNVAAHPRFPHIFATACDSAEILVWDAHERRNIMKGSLGFKCRGIAYSQEEYDDPTVDGGKAAMCKSAGFHLAVGGKQGRVAILDAEDLRPLLILHDSKQAVDVLRYSPARASGSEQKRPGLLAAGSHDLFIYLYNATNNYQFVAKCAGHSGTIETLDWSLPLSEPKKYEGKTILRSTCANAEILHWNPQTGKQITANQRNASWETYSAKYGFDVMGVWEDDSDRTDINSVDRSHRGAPRYDPDEGVILPKTDPESAEWTQGGGYLVTSEDSSNIKIFNYPVVQDDAPYRVFRGHSSHVMCIRFLSDDRRVVSVGAGDRAVMQWRTIGINQYDTEYDWCVMEGVDRAISKMADRQGSKIPKPGVSNWQAVQGSQDPKRASSYGVVNTEVRNDFGSYKDRSGFFASFVEGMHVDGGNYPPLVCSLTHTEAQADMAEVKAKITDGPCQLEHSKALPMPTDQEAEVKPSHPVRAFEFDSLEGTPSGKDNQGTALDSEDFGTTQESILESKDI